MRRSVALALCVSVAALTALPVPASAIGLPLNEVNIQAMTFFGVLGPVAVTGSGGTVKFVNHEFLGPIPHTATAFDGSFDTGLLQVHDEATITIDAPTGTSIGYFCAIHPFMVGVIVVA